MLGPTPKHYLEEITKFKFMPIALQKEPFVMIDTRLYTYQLVTPSENTDNPGNKTTKHVVARTLLSCMLEPGTSDNRLNLVQATSHTKSVFLQRVGRNGFRRTVADHNTLFDSLRTGGLATLMPWFDHSSGVEEIPA